MKESDNRNDEDIARLLEAAGPREQLPEELRSRWESHFRAELQRRRAASPTSHRRRYGLPLAALAASIVALMLVLDRFAAAPEPGTPIQVLAVSGTAELLLESRGRLAAVVGQNLSSGVTVQTAGDSQVALRWQSFDVRLNAGTLMQLRGDKLHLQEGEVYLSNVGRRPGGQRATVVTPFAAISDIGTQFKVKLVRDGVVASVRQGAILVEAGPTTHRAEAAPGAGQSLRVQADNSVQLDRDDSDWSWIYAVSRSFPLEGRTVLEFLRWSASETGLALSFADETVALAARNTRLSGDVDISRIDPERALALVLSTTRFEANVREGTLLVSRRSE